ncbi:MAG: hypothetical protein CBD47_02910 [Synechococcus sp. TMED187]|nr:MAG: hypothetical protein CBD47_02910 [Synechococcus sp. TMED187]
MHPPASMSHSPSPTGQSSANMSHLKVARTCEELGATPTVQASRENVFYQIDTLKTSVPEAMEILADTIFAAKVSPWELDEQRALIKEEIEETRRQHQVHVQELVHTAAFGNLAPLGKPLLSAPNHLHAITPEVLGAFSAEQLTPDRMVLAAAGYDHDELVALAEATMGAETAGGPRTAESASYAGGEYRESSDDELTHMALAFRGVGWKDEDLVPLCVLNTMMGGGASFSAGGPGKGMYTRLYQNILNRFYFVESAAIFNAFYNDTGVFGVYGSAPAAEMGKLTSALAEEMAKMAGPITDAELSRAKNQLTTSLLMNLEQRSVLFEDIGRQVLTYGARTAPAELVAQISAVTSDDIGRVASSLLKSPPSVVVVGDTTSVPRYDQVAKMLA